MQAISKVITWKKGCRSSNGKQTMVNFGYTINRDRQIDFDKADKKIIEYVSKEENSINICLACGACTATCSAGNFTDFNIRKITAMLRIGEVGQVKEEMKKCMFCGKCGLACPRGVNTRNIILKINEAFKLLS